GPSAASRGDGRIRDPRGGGRSPAGRRGGSVRAAPRPVPARGAGSAPSPAGRPLTSAGPCLAAPIGPHLDGHHRAGRTGPQGGMLHGDSKDGRVAGGGPAATGRRPPRPLPSGGERASGRRPPPEPASRPTTGTPAGDPGGAGARSHGPGRV